MVSWLPIPSIALIEFPPSHHLDCLPDSEAEAELRLLAQDTVQLLRSDTGASQSPIPNPEEVVRRQMRRFRFERLSPLLYQCLEFRRLARIQDAARQKFRQLLWHRARRPDADGSLGQMEARLEDRIGWFDERERLLTIRQSIGKDDFRMDDFRMDEFLREITDADIDRFVELVDPAIR